MRTLLIMLCLTACATVHAQETFLLKKEMLQETRRKITRKDPATLKALAWLVKECDTLLTRGPYSVTYKSKVPPSGDKHDYMSVGPYWWPDSSKADGLPYIRKDGQINPERYTIRDADFQSSLNREVYTLAIGWYFTGKEAYARHAAKLLRTWYIDTATRMNPNLNYGQAIPGITDGRGIGLIDTRNADKLIDGMQLLKNSGALPKADYKAIQQWFNQYLTWMRTSPVGLDEADEKNNHGTWYDVQAVAIALFTEQKDSARLWLEQQTKARIESQLKQDGSQPHELARTLSWNYSQMNLKAFFELALLAENVNVDLWQYKTASGKTIEKAFSWLLPFAEGKQTWQHQQIKHMDTDGYLELAVMAKRKYPQLDLAPLYQKHNNYYNPMLQLVGWTY
ncbi:alginate lyase family protein [Chitinophaga horti]|uniref:Alginate lyase family protein n=1 Tax=Chitinophaga horti TaxID=2920382 RepID=A0ABY6IZ15_9BACT|nr:alginate lyase family protein [Chitinophaga horti]UYQ91254.1 alginate lyase family protein [Chitinophaga horti]